MFHLNAYSMPDGNPVSIIPFSSCSWREEWNEAGSMSVDILLSEHTGNLDLDAILLEDRTLLALFDGERIVHAGPILESPAWNADTHTVSVNVGGGWSLFDLRLVMDSQLRYTDVDGSILMDDSSKPSAWTLGFTGSPGDLIRYLIMETVQWGRLPVSTLSYESDPQLTMSWYGWDFVKLSDAFKDILGTDDGGQLRFDPELDEDGRLRFVERWARKGVTDRPVPFRWNSMAPEARVRFQGVDSGGQRRVNEMWMSGGKNVDKTFITVSRDLDALLDGEPLFQAGESDQNTENRLSVLHSHSKARLDASRLDRTWNFLVGHELNPEVGDLVEFTVNDRFLHETRADGTRTATVVSLIITNVEGTVGDEWLKVSCRQHGDTVNGVTSAVNDPLALFSRRLRDAERLLRKANSPTGTQSYQVVSKLQTLLQGGR